MSTLKTQTIQPPDDSSGLTFRTNQSDRVTIGADGFVNILNGTVTGGITLNGSLNLIGGITASGGATFGGRLRVTDSTASSSTSTGALTVSGGVGVGGDLYVSSTGSFGGLLTLAGATSSAVLSCSTAPTQGQHLVNKTYVDGQAIGVGQSWVDVTGSRAVATTYTNNTGKPIMVLITCRTGQRLDNNQVNGVSIGDIVSISTTTQNLTFIVPSGHTYSVGNTALTGRGFYIWSELR